MCEDCQDGNQDDDDTWRIVCQHKHTYCKQIKAGDNNASNIAELGIGTNHTMKELSGTVGDKMIIGTAHLAIGKNINIGGHTFSNIHHDGVMKDVSIEIDGKKILNNGNILV